MTEKQEPAVEWLTSHDMDDLTGCTESPIVASYPIGPDGEIGRLHADGTTTETVVPLSFLVVEEEPSRWT